MEKVGNIMKKKVISITPSSSVKKARDFMEKHKIGGLPVVDKGKIIGIVTSRDVRSHHPNRLVYDVMTKEVISATPDISLLEGLMIMKKNNIERLPVIEKKNYRLLGIITKQDILFKLNESEKLAVVNQLGLEMFDKIRNPLTIISSSVQYLQVKLKPRNTKRLIENIVSNVERIANVPRDYFQVTIKL